VKKLSQRLETAWASSMHFFRAQLLSISIITETYVRQTGGFITQTANKIKLCQCAACVLTHNHTVGWCRPHEYLPKPYTARYSKSLYWTLAMLIVWVYLYLFARNCLRKPQSPKLNILA